MTQTVQLSEYDFLELVVFNGKAAREGFAYAATEYAPVFEDPALPGPGQVGELRALWSAHRAAIRGWWDARPLDDALALHNTHVDAARQRADDACMWGARCENGNVLAVPTREKAQWLVDNPTWSGVELMARDEPGGPWHPATPDPVPTVTAPNRQNGHPQ